MRGADCLVVREGRPAEPTGEESKEERQSDAGGPRQRGAGGR